MNDIAAILKRATTGEAPTRAEAARLLELPTASDATAALCRCADAIARRRFAARGLLLAQIGMERQPCSGDCAFCSLAAVNFTGEARELTPPELAARVQEFVRPQLGALFLMATHDYPFERILAAVGQTRPLLPATTRLVVNIGDCAPEQYRALRRAGVSGAYHVRRLGEGCDTKLSGAARLASIRAIRDAGLDWYYCCEPIGPEHDTEALLDAIFLGNQYECYQHAAMSRVNPPGSPLEARGAISAERLAQIVAVIALVSLANPRLRSIAVHEPSRAALLAGANSVYAESGANPRDTVAETATGRGKDVVELSGLLQQCGWEL